MKARNDTDQRSSLRGASSRRILCLRIVLASVAMLGLAGCKVRQPGTWETAMARITKQKITVRGKSDRNPLPATPANIHAGRVIFSQYCMECHGADGHNTGVVFAERMSPPVPLLNSPAVQGYPDGQLKWVIENGIFPSGMPAWKGVLKEEEVWQVVDYIRHLPEAGGRPQVSGAGSETKASGSRAD